VSLAFLSDFKPPAQVGWSGPDGHVKKSPKCTNPTPIYMYLEKEAKQLCYFWNLKLSKANNRPKGESSIKKAQIFGLILQFKKLHIQSKQSPFRRKFGQSGHPGTDVMIFKIFSPKNWQKYLLAVFAQTTANFCKNLITTLVFEKNGHYFAENW
jgi:hypothetical protein